MEKTMLIGRIMERCSALGDAELAGMIGQLMVEVAPPSEKTNETMPSGTKYVLCVEATLDGKKIQHPVIGGSYMPHSVDDYKMIVGDDLVALQSENASLVSAIENRFPVKVRYVPVSDEALASLETKLKELINNLSEMIDKVVEAKKQAYDMMHATFSEDDISNDMIADVMRKTIYAGAGLDAAGNVVDREPDVKYDEEREIEHRNSTSEDSSDEENEEDEDDCVESDYNN